MERRKEEMLGDVILRYLRQSQLESPLNEYRLLAAWEKVAGTTVGKYTAGLRIYNQKLFVQLKSPALRTELMMKRTSLVQALNREVGANVITDILCQ